MADPGVCLAVVMVPTLRNHRLRKKGFLTMAMGDQVRAKGWASVSNLSGGFSLMLGLDLLEKGVLLLALLACLLPSLFTYSFTYSRIHPPLLRLLISIKDVKRR